MKKIFYSAFTMLCMIMAVSCSKSSSNEFLSMIPDDVDMVAILDVNTMIESADGSIVNSRIQLPGYINDMLDQRMGEQFDNFNDYLQESGVDVESFAVFGKYNDEQPVFLVKLSDAGKFTDFIQNVGFTEDNGEGGYSYYEMVEDSYYSEYSTIAVKDNYAYAVLGVWSYRSNGENRATEIIKKNLSELKEKSFSKGRINHYLAEGNAASFMIRIPKELRRELKRYYSVPSDVADMLKGYICFNCSLNGDKATAKMKCFDEDGSPRNIDKLDEYLDTSAKINKDALAYMANDESLVMAVAFKNINWDKILGKLRSQISSEEAAVMTMVKTYLEKIDGTIAFGIGVTNGLKSLVYVERGVEKELLNNLSMTLVIETRDNGAQTIINDLKNIAMSFGVDLQSLPDGFCYNIPEMGGKIYAKSDGKFLIIANHEISRNNNNLTVSKCNFSAGMAIGAAVDGSNSLMRDLGLPYEISCEIYANVKDAEVVANTEIGNVNGSGFIAKFLNICLEVYSNRRALSRTIEGYYREVYNSRYNNYYNYYDYYEEPEVEEAVEEVVEEEVAW